MRWSSCLRGDKSTPLSVHCLWSLRAQNRPSVTTHCCVLKRELWKRSFLWSCQRFLWRVLPRPHFQSWVT
uniref:Uncharacterized protein n=1 Tax=Anguilla anguilla TaxID=7936 RepID=A0A0E9WCA0_ANGAN